MVVASYYIYNNSDYSIIYLLKSSRTCVRNARTSGSANWAGRQDGREDRELTRSSKGVVRVAYTL